MKHKLTISTLLLLALFSALAPAALASTTWYVNGVNGSDGHNCKSPTTACKTIAHAISLAASGDTIMVAAATYGGNLTISKSLNLIGASAQTTIIDGGGVNRGVTISNSAAQVTLSQLTVRHGSAQNGGGIYNSGTLTINHCVITGNSAKNTYAGGGGIETTGNLTINASTISGNSVSGSGGSFGGGINDSGTLTINNSTISKNRVGDANSENSGGGGISKYEPSGALTINNTTVSGNSVQAGTSGVAEGGGIEAGSGTINNSTISGNSASGGGGSFGGGLALIFGPTINNSTISGNSAATGGGIYQKPHSGFPILQNTIVANSPSGGNCHGHLISNGYNMSSDRTCNFSNSGDRNNTDPKLGTLGNYGGPTQTIPLLSGSPAIDAGNPSGCTDGSGHLLKTDQRGYPRPDKEDSGGCDMGAFEKQSD